MVVVLGFRVFCLCRDGVGLVGRMEGWLRELGIVVVVDGYIVRDLWLVVCGCLVLFGTGSWPDVPPGRHRAMRLMPSQMPFAVPCCWMAWYVYCEQVGWCRHSPGAMYGEMACWYMRMAVRASVCVGFVFTGLCWG